MMQWNKRCATCRLYRSCQEFSRSASTLDGLSSTCKGCQKVRKEEEESGTVVSEKTRYEELLIAQKGLCAICGKPECKRRPSGKAARLLPKGYGHGNGAVQLLCSRCGKVYDHVVSQRDAPRLPRGLITIYRVDESTQRATPLFSKPNLLLYTWAYIVCKCVGHGDPAYKISSLYLEYENVALPGDTVPVPSFQRSDGLSYYNGLAAPKDFLRVALASSPSITIEPGFESYFTEGVDGNKLNFFAQSVGTQGILGRAFSDTVNSKIYGVALVATPSPTDRTQDILFARSYFDDVTYPQQLKLAGSQIGVGWGVPFE